MKGEPFVWATGAALSFTLAMTAALLAVVLVNGLGVFWPTPVFEVKLQDGKKLLGDIVDRGAHPETGVACTKYRVGNKEDQTAYVWVDEDKVVSTSLPAGALVLDREKDLQYFGYLERIEGPDVGQDAGEPSTERLAESMAAVRARERVEIEPIAAEEKAIDREFIGQVKYRLINVRYKLKQYLKNGGDENGPEAAQYEKQIRDLKTREASLIRQSDELRAKSSAKLAELRRNVGVFVDSAGRQKSIALLDIVRFTCPNSMSFGQKVRHYLAKVWELVSDNPREANQDGGIFPAIFGTVLMVFIMSATCFPLGVLAGIYLGEYAKEGPLVKLVRIAVNNLAGIPSIVYGIFGLGFFIYLVGGQLDSLFYADCVDANEPVFGKSCIFWASLTLGLLTIPVVIVSTEEAIRTIPRGVSESSYALGATKFQTLCRVLVPMASPGMMTGFILAMARAAGEVAPLMLTGAVKTAPLPVDGQFPFVRMDQKFMHLGYHILDISCKSPNIEATKPLVYVTTLLLLVIVLTMSSAAIYLRNRMKKRFESRSI